MAEAETAIEAAAIEGSLNFNCNLPFASHSFSLSFSICLSLSIYICLSLCLYPILPLCLFISLCTFHYLSVSLYLYIYIFFSLSISISYSSSFLFVFSSLLINIYHFFPLSSFALPPTISTLSVSLSLSIFTLLTLNFPLVFSLPLTLKQDICLPLSLVGQLKRSQSCCCCCCCTCAPLPRPGTQRGRQPYDYNRN